MKSFQGKTEAEIAELLAYGGKDAGVLQRFMQEFFPYKELQKMGFFKKGIGRDYYAQAKRVCDFFEYSSVFQHGTEEFIIHLSYAEGERPEGEGFFKVIKSIYE